MKIAREEWFSIYKCMRAQSLQSCLTLCDCLDRSLPGSSVHGILMNTGVGCHVFLKRIFPTQWSNPLLLCLLHCRWILYPLSHLGSPSIYKETPIELLVNFSAETLQNRREQDDGLSKSWKRKYANKKYYTWQKFILKVKKL